jgi:hypothetical protein
VQKWNVSVPRSGTRLAATERWETWQDWQAFLYERVLILVGRRGNLAQCGEGNDGKVRVTGRGEHHREGNVHIVQ